MSERPTREEALRLGRCRGCMHYFTGLGGPAQLCPDNQGRCPGRTPHPAREKGKEEKP